MTVIAARREAACDDLAPQHPFQRLTEQLAGSRIGLAHHAVGVDDDDATGQQVQQVLQAVGQALFLRQFGHALGADDRQLPLQLGDTRFKHAVGVAQLGGHLVEQRKRLLKAKPAGLFNGGLALEFRVSGHGGGLWHRDLSRGIPS